MVEPVSLTLGAVVAGFAVKAAEAGGEAAGSGAVSVMRRLVAKLRSWLTGQGDQEAAEALAKVEDAPDSPSRVAFLAALLDERARQDEAFKTELEQLIEAIKDAGGDVPAVQQTAIGDGNIQIGHASGGASINIGKPPTPRSHR